MQKTLAGEGSVSGVGIHSGRRCTVRLEPAQVNSGVQFFKKGKPVLSTIFTGERRTSLGALQDQIETVEHLLAAVCGLGITNLVIDVEGSELPAVDGSAAPFVRLFKELGIVEQGLDRECYRIREPIFCYEANKAIAIYPADELSVAYLLDYDHPFLKNQGVDFTLSPRVFENEIAPARTFCTQEEAGWLRERGLGLGGGLENTLVISHEGPLGNTLRFPDECARHKVLDILGDLQLLDFSVLGRVVGIRSGHALNRKLVEEIAKQRGAMDTKQREALGKSTGMDSEEIKKVLPHRYPFLLIDRVLELSETAAVGIKNISVSEPFFQGHFPSKPLMPGVLMIEALAQLAGVLLLSKSENKGKLAYLVAVNEARFRKMVVPGDQLRLEVQVIKMKAKVGLARCKATVSGEEVCGAEIMFKLGD